MGTGIEVDGVPVADKGTGFPIGWPFIQFPGMKAPIPAEMPDIVGVWEPVVSMPAGAFIRLPGGDASEFESGLQPDQTQVIKAKSGGSLVCNSNVKNPDGPSGALEQIQEGTGQFSSGGSAFKSFEIDTSKDPSIRTGSKGYPENITIILWERKS